MYRDDLVTADGVPIAGPVAPVGEMTVEWSAICWDGVLLRPLCCWAAENNQNEAAAAEAGAKPSGLSWK